MTRARPPRRLPPVLADAVSEAAGRSSRHDPVLPGTGGPAGNASLTAWTGLLLLVLSLAELVTLLDVRRLVSWHVVLGALLVPPALLKTASTGWRVLRYYRGQAAYATAGPPPLALRLLGPAVVVTTLSLLGSGLALVFLGAEGSRRLLVSAAGLRVDWLTLHQGAFIAWAAATGLHVLGRFVPALRLTVARPSDGSIVPGLRPRLVLLGATVVTAVVTSLLVLSAASSWQTDGDAEGRPPLADGVGSAAV
jgi:hypothetical protein